MNLARKRFGQHFLHDQEILQRIVAAFHPQPGQRIIEIGPGRGALTEKLLQAVEHLNVIEIDRDLVDQLGRRFGEGLTIHSKDVLKFDFHRLGSDSSKLRVIGNLPYNISTPLLFHLLDYYEIVDDMVFMLQKEVVDRIVAQPGNKDYGRLSIMIQSQCKAEALFDVPPTAFSPPPKVESSVIHLKPYKKPCYSINDTKLFAQLVNTAFSKRRKTLRNALKGWVDTSTYTSLEIDSTLRPEQISIADYVNLANSIRKP